MSTQRAGRVADQIRQLLASLLREGVRDPRLGFVTLTDLELSSDLRHARVFVSFIVDDTEDALRALRKAAPFLRRSLARTSGLRHTPELRFEIDPSVESGTRVDRILDQLESTRDSSDGEDS